MEQARGTPETSNFASEDVISNMPENVMTDIMNRLPIRDAVRTSILSRKWMFKWTMLTQLVFDEEFSMCLRGPERKENYDTRIISRLLLNIKGPVTKFVLSIPYYKELDVEDINHWVMFLSRKGMEEFQLTHGNITPLKLPSHLFSCRELKHLKLFGCFFQPPTSFCGFPNLMSLDLFSVTFESSSFRVITLCPLLEILRFRYNALLVKVELTEIAKLGNLKILSLPLCILDNTVITTSSIILLGHYLPKLAELLLDFRSCKFLEDDARKWDCTTFSCLKTLKLHRIDFSSHDMLSFVFGMIWGSPNLRNLSITAIYNDATPPPAFCYSDVDNNSMEQLELLNVVFSWFRGSENELCLIESLLACSPFLNKITIVVDPRNVFGGEKGKLVFATKLLELPRASTVARVHVTWA